MPSQPHHNNNNNNSNNNNNNNHHHNHHPHHPHHHNINNNSNNGNNSTSSSISNNSNNTNNNQHHSNSTHPHGPHQNQHQPNHSQHHNHHNQHHQQQQHHHHIHPQHHNQQHNNQLHHAQQAPPSGPNQQQQHLQNHQHQQHQTSHHPTHQQQPHPMQQQQQQHHQQQHPRSQQAVNAVPLGPSNPAGPQQPGQPPVPQSMHHQQQHPGPQPGTHPGPFPPHLNAQQHPGQHPQHLQQHGQQPQTFIGYPFNFYPPHMMPYHHPMQGMPNPYQMGPPMQPNPALMHPQTRVIASDQMGSHMMAPHQFPHQQIPNPQRAAPLGPMPGAGPGGPPPQQQQGPPQPQPGPMTQGANLPRPPPPTHLTGMVPPPGAQQMQPNPALVNQQTRVITNDPMGPPPPHMIAPQFAHQIPPQRPMGVPGGPPHTQHQAPTMGPQGTLLPRPPHIPGMIPIQGQPHMQPHLHQQPPAPREKKRLQIIDPATMRALTEDELKTTPASQAAAAAATAATAVTSSATTTAATTSVLAAATTTTTATSTASSSIITTPTTTNIPSTAVNHTSTTAAASSTQASSPHGSQSSSSKDSVTSSGFSSANPSITSNLGTSSRETLSTVLNATNTNNASIAVATATSNAINAATANLTTITPPTTTANMAAQNAQSSTIETRPTNELINNNKQQQQQQQASLTGMEVESLPAQQQPYVAPATLKTSNVSSDRGDNTNNTTKTNDSAVRYENMVSIQQQEDLKQLTSTQRQLSDQLYPEGNGDIKVKDEVDHSRHSATKEIPTTNQEQCKLLVEGDALSAKVASLTLNDQEEKSTNKINNDQQEDVVGNNEQEAAAADAATTTHQKQQPASINNTLPYESGQFSPLNKQGFRRYSIEFLKAVAVEKLKIDFKKQAIREDFAPSFMPANYRDLGPLGSQNSMRRQTQQTPQKPRKIIEIPIADQAPELKSVENPWKPELNAESKIVPDEMDTKRLIKVFRGHLNKLTPQKYDSIIQKIEELDLDGQERLYTVICLVFDKAVDEPSFCELYARMCKVIAGKNTEFCYHLVKKCQEEFETEDLYEGLNIDERNVQIDLEEDPLKRKTLSEELYEEMRLRRKKYLGTIKLIGEMYKLGLLAPKIIGLCMSHLLIAMSNENIECLCSLIETVGSRMVSEPDQTIKDGLQNYLKILNDIANEKVAVNECFVLESRIKFKILDTVDLSRRNWRPRITENKPQKLEEIRDEIKDELRQQHYNTIQANHHKPHLMRQQNDDRNDNQRNRGGGLVANSGGSNSSSGGGNNANRSNAPYNKWNNK